MKSNEALVSKKSLPPPKRFPKEGVAPPPILPQGLEKVSGTAPPDGIRRLILYGAPKNSKPEMWPLAAEELAQAVAARQCEQGVLYGKRVTAMLASSSLMLTAPQTLQWSRDLLPDPGPEDVVIETTGGAISIGSEIPQYLGTNRGVAPAHYPRMTGYESVGRVIQCGSAVQDFRVGDRAIAFYGHRTHAVIPAASIVGVPVDMSDALALLAILSCDVAKGVRKLAPLPEQPIAISGAGAIGLLTVFTLTALTCYQVDVFEPRPERRELARRLGARAVFAPEEIGERADDYALGFECSSSDQAFALLQRLMRYQGQICILADGNLEPLTLTPAFHRKELLVVGSSDGWDYRAHATWYFHTIRQRPFPLEALFDCQVQAEELPATFADLASGNLHCVKVLVRYSGDLEP